MKKLLLILSLFISVYGSAQIAGWQHALPIIVTNNSLVDTPNYKLDITVNTAQYVSTGEMLASGNDIRFGGPCGSQLYNYYIASGMNTTNTRIFVQLPMLKALTTDTLYMYYGNNTATAVSNISILEGPFSSTDSVVGGGSGGVSNSQRGFRFSPNVPLVVTKFGKNEPTGSTRYVTLFDFTSEAILGQNQVSGPAGQYSYASITNPIVLNAGQMYIIEIYQAATDGYYFGAAPQTNSRLNYIDMRYCNGCTQTDFPTNSLGGMHYGYVDFQFYSGSMNTTTYTYGNPSTLPNTAAITTPNSSICGSQQVTFTATTSSGSGIYTFTKNGNPVGTGMSTYTDNGLMNGDNIQVSIIDSAFCQSVSSNIITITVNDTNTWTGATDTLWSKPTNWSCGIIPVATTTVIIPAVVNHPVIDIPNAICKNITIALGTGVTFKGTNNQLEVRGDLTANGVFVGDSGKLVLNGTIAQNVNGNILLEDLEVNGGTTKVLNSNIVVTDTLSLTNGCLQLNGTDIWLIAPEKTKGGSDSSFIVTSGGGIVRAYNIGLGGNPAITFHVGINDTSYTPVTLANIGIADTFSVSVMQHVYEDGYGQTTTQVTNPVVDRTWLISENTPGGSFATLTAQWNGGEEVNNFDYAHVYVAHYMNNEWTSSVDSAIFAPPAIGTDPYIAIEDSITSFSPFAVASYGQFPLTIKLATISASNTGSRNKVQWSSYSESISDHYELERSIDGHSFTKIATIAAKGKNSDYTQWDENAVTGINYYRVKLVDASGATNYSKVVTATVGAGNTFAIEAYPNPARNIVSVKVNGTVTGKGTIIITDVTGKVVVSATEVENNAANINLSNIATGMYLLNYSDDVRNETIKINKQ